jgi:hypothetical protein
MPEPALSVLVFTPDAPATMRHTLAALGRQTLRAQIEVVLVGPTESALRVPDESIAGFAAVQRVVVERFESLGQVTAAGVRAASAALVALTEDHCHPHPGWAEALVARHAQGDYAAVGPTVHNANPATLPSWQQFLVEYAGFSAIGAKGAARMIPGHNSCYRRADLLHYEPDLAWWLECETLMHWDMAERGRTLWLDAAAQTDHWNCSRFGPTLRFSWLFPRVFAARRCRVISAAERAKLALLWPLIPPLRLCRTWPLAVAALGRRRALRVLPGLFVNLVVSGASEATGYLFGEGDRAHTTLDLEFHRDRFMRSAETIALLDHPSPAAVTEAAAESPSAQEAVA